MTLSQGDYFILTQTIRGVQERVKEMRDAAPDYTKDKLLEEIQSLLCGLKAVVFELTKEMKE